MGFSLQMYDQSPPYEKYFTNSYYVPRQKTYWNTQSSHKFQTIALQWTKFHFPFRTKSSPSFLEKKNNHILNVLFHSLELKCYAYWELSSTMIFFFLIFSAPLKFLYCWYDAHYITLRKKYFCPLTNYNMHLNHGIFKWKN